jgi:hypothetical protein
MGFLWAIGFLILSYAITALTTPKPQVTNATPSTLSDFTFPTHDEGTPEAVVFGDCWIEDWMVLYYGNLRSDAIHQSATSSSGGKK